jgi:hypothetical protein
MQRSSAFTTISILAATVAVFAETLGTSLTVQPAAALCSKSGACADTGANCPAGGLTCASQKNNPSLNGAETFTTGTGAGSNDHGARSLYGAPCAPGQSGAVKHNHVTCSG